MLKTYQKYIIQNFLSKIALIITIFFSLIFIMGSLEEISFVKNLNLNFIYPYYLTLLNTPITLFEIFPFIFLLSTQFFFYDLFKKDELNLLRINGLNNFSLIKILLIIALFIGVINVIFFYNFASNLKFYYSDIKNGLSSDNKYLAMVNKSGLWIKDEIEDKKLIVKSNLVKDNIISKTIINEFDKDFELIRVIQSEKIDIRKNEWIIYSPLITIDNQTFISEDKIILSTNFNYEKISKLFSNVSTLDLFKLFDVKNDFERLGYSSDEIFIHLLKLITTPLLYVLLTIISSIIMFGFKRNSSLIYHISTGFLMSVVIYYIIFFFVSLGNSGKIPAFLSVIFPLCVLSLISIMGIINVNEK